MAKSHLSMRQRCANLARLKSEEQTHLMYKLSNKLKKKLSNRLKDQFTPYILVAFKVLKHLPVLHHINCPEQIQRIKPILLVMIYYKLVTKCSLGQQSKFITTMLVNMYNNNITTYNLICMFAGLGLHIFLSFPIEPVTE